MAHRHARILRSGFYQSLKAPTMTASEATDATTPRRIRAMRMRNSCPPGDDGLASITTRSGDVQVLPVSPPAPIASRSPWLLHLYVLFFAALAIGIVVALVTLGFELPHTWVVVSLGLLAAAAERARVRITSNLTAVSYTHLTLPTILRV